MTSPRTRTRFAVPAIALVVLAAAVPGVRAAWNWSRIDSSPAMAIPTTVVKRGQVDTNIYANGELRTTKSTLMFAPPAGAQMRLLTLLATGSPVKAGDVVMSFDPSDQENTLEEQRALLREAELEIEKSKAEGAAQAAQDEVDLLTAKFDVKKAELDVSANELRGAIDARKNELTLEENKRHLAQLQDDITSHTQTSNAAVAVAREKRTKAKLAMDAAQRLIAQMTMRSPIDGFVAVRPNDEGMSFFYNGMTAPEYRAGDMVSSGRQVAEVLDVAQMELVAQVAETDRSRVAAGQRADVHIDHEPTVARAAHVTNVGGVRMGGFGRTMGPVRLFDVVLALDHPLLSGRPGLSASMVINGEPLQHVLYLPRQAVFDQDGKPTVFIKRDADAFERRAIKISARTDTLVVIEDLAEGAEVALIDPEQKAGAAARAGAGASSPARLVTP